MFCGAKLFSQNVRLLLTESRRSPAAAGLPRPEGRLGGTRGLELSPCSVFLHECCRYPWFGAELDPDGDQIWFRIDEDAIGRMPEKTPAARGDRLIDALIVWITTDRPLEPRHQPLRGPGLRARRHVDRTAAVVRRMDSIAPSGPPTAAVERPPPTALRLAEASLSPNTRRAYSGALRRLDAWLDGRRLEDATLAAFLAELHDQGRAPASAATAVAAACFRARLAGEPSPGGERTARVLAGYRRTAGERGRGQARPFGAALCCRRSASGGHLPTGQRLREDSTRVASVGPERTRRGRDQGFGPAPSIDQILPRVAARASGRLSRPGGGPGRRAGDRRAARPALGQPSPGSDLSRSCAASKVFDRGDGAAWSGGLDRRPRRGAPRRAPSPARTLCRRPAPLLGDG